MKEMIADRARLELIHIRAPALIDCLSRQTQRVLVAEQAQAHAFVALHGLALRVLYSQLPSLVLFLESPCVVTEWREQIQLPSLYGPWLEESLRILEQHGHVTQALEGCTGLLEASDGHAAWAEWDQRKAQWDQDENLRAQMHA